MEASAAERAVRIGAAAMPKEASKSFVVSGPSQPPPRRIDSSTSSRARSTCKSGKRGIRPGGSRRHSAYPATRARAVAARSGKG